MKEIPTKERVKDITDMMYELGMYTQADEIDRLAEAYWGATQRICDHGPGGACANCADNKAA